jgi:hypothetical protein
LVTTDPAPTTIPSPNWVEIRLKLVIWNSIIPSVTPGQIIAHPPIQQSLPIVIDLANSLVLLSIGSIGCDAVYTWTPMIDLVLIWIKNRC